MMYLTSRNPINVIRTSFGNWIRSIADDQGLPLLSVPQKYTNTEGRFASNQCSFQRICWW